MARIDVPTLQCDRCEFATQDESVMARFITLRNNWAGYGKPKDTAWDLCGACYAGFITWVRNDEYGKRP